MTALVALSIYSTDEVISVPEVCTKVDSSKIGLPATEKFKVIDLINAMLIQSAGDAACTLASVKVPYNDFIILMNTKAKNYGMQHTQFTNPIGLDGANYSTARDLYILAKNAVSNPVISKAVRSPSYSFKSRDEKYNITAYTTNKLLTDVPYSIGIKTGTTAEAGEVFIYEYKNGKKDLIIIVMGSTDRFTDTKNLLTWLLSSYTWE
jgi:D-alanyl-D-alanine carboxypeptidase (penicillin-binding protein 5/6)